MLRVIFYTRSYLLVLDFHGSHHINIMIMKKITFFAIAVFAFSLSSCKKDYVCECTNTYTSSSGNVTTDPNDRVTYKDIKKGDAKNLCQRTTGTYVSASGATSSYVYDCKLK